MSLTHNNNEFPGIVRSFMPGPFELHPWETHFGGVDGISRIEGGAGKRIIQVDLVLFNNFDTRQKLRSFIDDSLNWDFLGQNGQLEYDGDGTSGRGFNAPYADCTFEGFTPTDQDRFDDAGTLDGGWFSMGILRFVQLSKDG
jgi:hypothetical protein